MFRYPIILSFSLLISACSDQVDKEFNREGKQLSVTTIFSDNMKRDVWKYDEGIMGQALYSPNDTVCEIIISSKLSIGEQQKTLGHELMHCLYGDYHKQQHKDVLNFNNHYRSLNDNTSNRGIS